MIQCQGFEHSDIFPYRISRFTLWDLQDHVDVIRHDYIFTQANSRAVRHLMDHAVCDAAQLCQLHICSDELIAR